jgi:hypothetical protein
MRKLHFQSSENSIWLTLLASPALLHPLCPLFPYPDFTDICISSCWTNATASRCAALKHVFSSPRGGITLIGRLRPLCARTHARTHAPSTTRSATRTAWLPVICNAASITTATSLKRLNLWKGDYECTFFSWNRFWCTTELFFPDEG